MAGKKYLRQNQLAVLDDLFGGSEFDVQAVLDKHKVSRRVYDKWLIDKEFCDAFERRITALNRHSELIIAKYSAVAAAKLVGLTESAKAETARKACFDIISFPKKPVPKAGQGDKNKQKDEEKAPCLIAPKTASRLLAALAEENSK